MDVIFDLDGTLADLSHRVHLVRDRPKNHKEFFKRVGNDAPIKDVIRLWHILQGTDDYTMYIVSGRSDQCRTDTLQWLANNSLYPFRLHMRRAGDYRADSIVKQEILDEHWPGERKKDIFCVFDDRDRVVEMWRANGIRCYQVAPGDF